MAHLSPPPVAVAGGDGGIVASEAVISSDTESDSGGGKRPNREASRGCRAKKRARLLAAAASVPPAFLDPLPPAPPAGSVTRQFWKAGDYDGKPQLLGSNPAQHSDSGMEHIRVHPRFLHSNATSHKWALGAFAELLDNSVDEVLNGATYVNIDVLANKKDGTRMLLIQDDGGGMDPDKLRHCMSLGYSAKSKVKNTIGQYGNGFKTSTMRLGADVVVFSRSCAREERRVTQSIGLLSYTYLKSTGKDDIIVPMLRQIVIHLSVVLVSSVSRINKKIDYEKAEAWKIKVRTTSSDWHTSLQTITQWSPYSTEAELLQEFRSINEQGTRIVIYNLWEDEHGELELDFDADVNDIQMKGANRDQENIQMAKQFPNSKHFFTHKHSLRSYASILYLQVPDIFRMILRGKEIQRHNIINDMMLKKHVTYKPVTNNGCLNYTGMVANVTIGFVKDAKYHVATQGFNVYHKNRLIKPFWRVWTLAGSQGRGIIGVLEVNFVEPAHDKQDFERTNSLSRLEARLVVMQKKYWSDNCHRIGYSGSRAAKSFKRREEGPSSYQSVEYSGELNCFQRSEGAERLYYESSNKNRRTRMSPLETSRQFSSRTTDQHAADKSARPVRSARLKRRGLLYTNDDSDAEIAGTPSRSIAQILNTPERTSHQKITVLPSPPSDRVITIEKMTSISQSKDITARNNAGGGIMDDPETVIKQLKDENSSLKACILKLKETLSKELQIEREKNKSLIERVKSVQIELETANKEHETMKQMFSEETKRLGQEEEKLRMTLKEASSTIQDLLEKLNAARNCHETKKGNK